MFCDRAEPPPRRAVLEMNHLSALLIVTAAIIVLYGQIDYAVDPYAKWDLSHYRTMASASPGIATNVGHPFAFRVLGPYLVGLLPFPDPVGFYGFAVVLSLGLVFLLYYFLQSVGLSPSASLVTVVLFAFNRHWFGFTIWDYFQVNDLLSLVFILVLFWAMLNDRWMVFGVTLFLGAMTRETAMLMIPVVFAYLLEKKEISTRWRKALIAIGPGLIAFFLLRFFVPTTGGTLLEAFHVNSRKVLSPERLFRLMVNSFLPFSLIPLVFFEMTFRFFRARIYALVFVILVFLSALFGSNDERLMAPAFIIVYLLLGVVIQALNSEKTFLAIFISGGFLSSLHHITGRYPLPNETLTWIFSLVSLLVVTIAAIAFRVKGARPTALPQVS